MRCHENKYARKLSLLCHTAIQKPAQELDAPTIVFLFLPSLRCSSVPAPLCFWRKVWVFIYILKASPDDCGSVLLLQQKCTYLVTLLMAFLRSNSTYWFMGVATLGSSGLAVLGHHPHTPLRKSPSSQGLMGWWAWEGCVETSTSGWGGEAQTPRSLTEMAAVLQGKGKDTVLRSSCIGELRRKNQITPSPLSLISRAKDVISSKEHKRLSSGTWLLTAREQQSCLVQSLPDLWQDPGEDRV